MSTYPDPQALPSVPSNAPMPFQSNALFEWVDDRPRPRATKSMVRDQIVDLFTAAAALPYIGEWDPITYDYVIEDPRFEGCTMAEVMVMRLADKAVTKDGDKARDTFLDRILGKPKQSIESATMTGSYSEWLEWSAAQGAKEEPDYYSNTYDIQHTTVDELDELTRGI